MLKCKMYTYFGKWVFDFSLTASMYIFPDSTALRTSPANSMLQNAKQLSMSSRYILEMNGSLCSIVGFCFQVKNSLCITGSTWKTSNICGIVHSARCLMKDRTTCKVQAYLQVQVFCCTRTLIKNIDCIWCIIVIDKFLSFTERRKDWTWPWSLL